MRVGRSYTCAASLGLLALLVWSVVAEFGRTERRARSESSPDLCTLTIRLIPALDVPVTMRVDSTAKHEEISATGPKEGTF